MPQRVTALLESIGFQEIADLSPADRQRLGDQCQRVLAACRKAQGDQVVKEARKATAPKAGVLGALESGERAL